MIATTTSAKLLAFHGDPDIKERYLVRVRAHRAADDIIRGTYGRAIGSSSGWRGCAVGCTIHGKNHVAYEEELGIPEALAYMEDSLFEVMPKDRAMDWPIEFLAAIPVGADLSLVVWKVLEQGVRDLLRFANDDTRHAMERVLREVLEPMSLAGVVSAARAAACADAANAAGAAARDAAYAAAAAAYAAGAAARAASYAASYASYAARAAAAARAANAAGAAARAAADAARAASYAAAYASYATRAACAAGANAAGAAARDAAAAAADMGYQWSRWLLEFMAAAPVVAREEVSR